MEIFLSETFIELKKNSDHKYGWTYSFNYLLQDFHVGKTGKNAEPSHFHQTGVRTLSSDPCGPGFPGKFPLFCLGSSGIKISILQFCPCWTEEHTSSGSTDVLGSSARAAGWNLPCGLQWCLLLTQPARIMLFSPCHGVPWRQLKLSWARKKEIISPEFPGAGTLGRLIVL